MLAEPEVTSLGGSAVPWALPNENIPMRIWWPRNFELEQILVSLPEGFRCVEVVNARNTKVWKNQIDIRGFPEGAAATTKYVGLVVKSNSIQEELDRTSQVLVRFVRDGRVVEKLQVNLRTLRPKLSLIRAPPKLQVKPGESKLSLPLELRYVGFGDIKVNLVATYRGQIVSQGESLVYEVMRRLWLQKDKPVQTDKSRKAEVDPSFVGKMTREIVERLESGNISAEELDVEVVRNLKDWLNELGAERIRQVLYARVEDLLVGVLYDLVLRNPINGVRLEEPRTRLMAKVQFPVNEIDLDVKYRDLIGNRYDPVRVKVIVEYLGPLDKPVPLDIPVTVTRWEHEPIMNVGGRSS